jgi:hypothetical protein
MPVHLGHEKDVSARVVLEEAIPDWNSSPHMFLLTLVIAISHGLYSTKKPPEMAMKFENYMWFVFNNI